MEYIHKCLGSNWFIDYNNTVVKHHTLMLIWTKALKGRGEGVYNVKYTENWAYVRSVDLIRCIYSPVLTVCRRPPVDRESTDGTESKTNQNQTGNWAGSMTNCGIHIIILEKWNLYNYLSSGLDALNTCTHHLHLIHINIW